MAIIEILGPPGVGKSSLRRRLMQGNPGRAWDSRKEAIEKISGLPKLSKADRFVLKKKVGRVLLQERPGLYDAFVRVRSSWRCLYKDTLMRTLYVDRDMVSDDSLCHYFLPELLVLAREDGAAFSQLCRNRKFVVLNSSPALIAQNVRHREHRGVYRTGVSSSTDGALMRRAENYNANLRSFVDLCRMHGIPYMAFDYENNTDIDADVLRFINARPG
jgi:hypothetical protein